MKKFKRHFKRVVIDFYKTLALYKYYNLKSEKAKNKNTMAIVMFDGRVPKGHGGLSDRLWGILSTYKYCIDNDIDFRINFVSPYKLEEFLEPNEYDWSIHSSEISYNLTSSRPFYLSMFYRDPVRDYIRMNKLMKKSINQNHVYTNTRTITDAEYGNLFNTLFKPSKILQQAIDENKAKIGKPYITLTFRFQQLLGDFSEGNFPILKTEKEKQDLIEKCLQMVEYLHNIKKMPILVTSESTRFLREAEKFDYVLTIPGKVSHIDFEQGTENTAVHLKSFVDMMMIANGEEIYMGYIPPLYNTTFPKTCSNIFGKPYRVITEDEICKYKQSMS